MRVVAPKPVYTQHKNLHITLKFLGEVPEARVNELCDALAGIEPSGETDLAFDAVVCLPPRGPVRILGVGVQAAPSALLQLFHRIEDVCLPLGFPLEPRAFLPHVTVARAKMPLHPSLRPALVQAAEALLPGPNFAVSGFTLMHSDLRPQGPLYTPIARMNIELPQGKQKKPTGI